MTPARWWAGAATTCAGRSCRHQGLAVRPRELALAVAWAALAPACAGPVRPGGAAAQVAARRVATDSRVATPTGATLVVPAGWWVSEVGSALVLEDPARELRLTLVTTAEPDGARAIARAWAAVAPGFALPLRGTPESQPPTGGWPAITAV